MNGRARQQFASWYLFVGHGAATGQDLDRFSGKRVQFESAMAGDLKISIEKLEARTKAGRLRGLMPVIEAKVKQGIGTWTSSRR